MEDKKKLTRQTGAPVPDNQNVQTAGPRGPLLMQDYWFLEKMANFDREVIPERRMHAKGSGAFGTFTVTHDISQYTKANIFDKIGKQTEMFARFSTVAGERGAADAERDIRGFALKFYTEEGIWDMVGNNTPVFFFRDPMKFPDLNHAVKRDPKTNMRSAQNNWDFWTLLPEALHQVTIVMSDRGLPNGYRHMHGFGSHTYSFINKDNVRHWVKFHFRTQQGIDNLTDDEAAKLVGMDRESSQRDLFDNIKQGNFPKWKMFIQIMTEEEAKTYRFHPFDLTKVWSKKDFPLIEVGEFELNKNAENYFADVEQSAFNPTNIVPGIGFSPDKMLQGRLFSYADAHRYRLGVNSHQLEVNRCPFAVNNFQRGGAMADDSNYGDKPNYYPNSFSDIEPDSSYKAFEYDLDNSHVAHYDRNQNDDDHYTQPGLFYTKALNQEARTALVNNIVGHMSGIDGPKRDEIINRQLCHFFRANIELGMRVAQGLGVNIDANTMNHTK